MNFLETHLSVKAAPPHSTPILVHNADCTPEELERLWELFLNDPEKMRYFPQKTVNDLFESKWADLDVDGEEFKRVWAELNAL